MRSVKINDIEYPVIEIYGKMRDNDWDDRESKTIYLVMTYNQAMNLFKDDISWSIIEEWQEDIINPETGEHEIITHKEEFDNSEFNVAGDVTDHRNGTVSITMGKETDLEAAYELLYGGDL